MSRCGRCKGRGWVRAIRGIGQLDCPACKGTGVKLPEPRPRRRTGSTLNCVQCGAEFYARPSLIAAGKRFCSRACYFASGASQTPEAQEKRRAANGNREGSANPNFKHGRRTGDQIRSFTLKLKGETCCRNCGATGVLNLHHALPRSLSREARDKLLNGVPLCPKCHHGWHRRSLTLYRDIFTADEWAYLCSVQLTGQRIEAWLDDHYPPRPAERAA